MDITIEELGGIEIGGKSVGEIEFTISKIFSFNAGKCIPYYWQVFGKCEKYSCLVWSPRSGIQETVPSGVPTTDDCKRTLSITVQACDIAEVCKKLSEMGFQFTIDKIYKYSKPALTRDGAYWDGCGAFIEVYPNPESGEEGLPDECLMFLLRETVNDNWNIDFDVEFVCEMDGTGGLEVDGEEDVVSSSYEIDGDGGLYVGESIYNFIGTFDTSINIQSELLEIEALRSTSNSYDILNVSSDLVDRACDCGPYPLVVGLRHNLLNSDKLKHFLDRNELSLPETINLVYNSRSYSWRSNFHFKGYGPSNSLETWDFLFEWGCTDEIGMIVVDKIWKFGLYIKQKVLDTNEMLDTKILLALDPREVCRDNLLRYNFLLNTELETVNVDSSVLNINANLNVCYDGMSLFGEASWLRNPILNITIYQNVSLQGGRLLDISPLLAESVIFG